MTGIHADWLTDPQRIRIVVVCSLALALMFRTLAGLLLQRILRISDRKRDFRYRIPLPLAHPPRSKSSGAVAGVPIQRTGPRSAALDRRAR